MKLAVMQPYLFPYAGYFQLIYDADLFLIYDDVSYVKQGYINRNSILSSNGVTRFTVPVPGASSNKLISELKFDDDVRKVLRTIQQSYSRAPYFNDIFPLVRNALTFDDRSIASVCQKNFEDFFSYLGIEKKFFKTSELNYDRAGNACDRLIALCQNFKADHYVNAPGGRKLYRKSDFAEHGIKLEFIDPLLKIYSQESEEFIPNLSIIDMLMNCSPSEVVDNLKCYQLN